jgi:hypothetical protein
MAASVAVCLRLERGRPKGSAANQHVSFTPKGADGGNDRTVEKGQEPSSPPSFDHAESWSKFPAIYEGNEREADASQQTMCRKSRASSVDSSREAIRPTCLNLADFDPLIRCQKLRFADEIMALTRRDLRPVSAPHRPQHEMAERRRNRLVWIVLPGSCFEGNDTPALLHDRDVSGRRDP